jgi:AcrR family transcriptional regulator
MFKSCSERAQGESMSEEELDARERMLRAAVELLAEGAEAASITTRRIADRAGVGVGLINYHFQSKDRLLAEAVAVALGQANAEWLRPGASLATWEGDDPAEALRAAIWRTAHVVAQHPRHAQILLEQDLPAGRIDTPLGLIPLLRRIHGSDASETELRLMAFQFIAATQLAALQPEAFRALTGLDIYRDEDRDRMLEFYAHPLLRGDREE